jgi:hypothetical protein
VDFGRTEFGRITLEQDFGKTELGRILFCKPDFGRTDFGRIYMSVNACKQIRAPMALFSNFREQILSINYIVISGGFYKGLTICI